VHAADVDFTACSNGDSDPPTVLCYAARELFAVLTLTIDGDVITKLHAVVDLHAWWSVQEGQTIHGETPSAVGQTWVVSATWTGRRGGRRCGRRRCWVQTAVPPEL
jgi:hypothetical protein